MTSRLSRAFAAVFLLLFAVLVAAVVWSVVSSELYQREVLSFTVTEHPVAQATGKEPSEPVHLTAGIWTADVTFIDFDPPTTGDQLSVDIDSASGRGGMGWSGSSWTVFYVGDVPSDDLATFSPGPVIVSTNAPDDVDWFVRFVRYECPGTSPKSG